MGLKRSDGMLADDAHMSGQVERNPARIRDVDASRTNHASRVWAIRVDVLQHDSIPRHQLDVVEFTHEFFGFQF